MSVKEQGGQTDPPLMAEEIIAALRQCPPSVPLCWIVCYEQRPLQGAPPSSTLPHLLVFSSPERAEAFIAGRLRFYMPEPLSVVAIDTAQTLKNLVLAPARDPRYKPPPYGLLLNFAYPTGATDRRLSPEQGAELAAEPLAKALGLHAAAPPTVDSLADELDRVITAMCASPGRSFSMEAHAAPLNSLLARSQIPKEVAALFVEVTTISASLRGVSTDESIQALTKLCAIPGPVVDNLLHRIASMSDAEHRVNVFDLSGRSASGTRSSQVSFEQQRKMAREELAKRGSPEYDPRHYVETSQPAKAAPLASPPKTVESSILRLADPAHPAHEHLEQAVRIVDQYVQVELVAERTALHVSAPAGEMEKALSSLDKAIALCPDDMDLLVAKASLLHASAQFKSAEELLDAVLSQAPDHFEAQIWKSHWETWSDALRFPRWDERQPALHPVMAAHLRLDHRLQVVRDGMQKALAVVAAVQGPPFDPRTQAKVEWVLSKTPYGPLVAYYVKIIEPSEEPSTMEAFLPIFQPTLFSPMEGYFLVQQLAFTPCCFVVLVSGNRVVLNRRIVLGQKTRQKVREMASQLSAIDTYLAQGDFQSAMRWHMSHFDMARLEFEPVGAQRGAGSEGTMPPVAATGPQLTRPPEAAKASRAAAPQPPQKVLPMAAMAPAAKPAEEPVAATAKPAAAPAITQPALRRQVPRWAWALGALLVGALAIAAILFSRQPGRRGTPGIDAPLPVQDGTIQVLGVERTGAITVGGQTARAHAGYDILLANVQVEGTVPLACVPINDKCRPIFMGHWDLVDAAGARYPVTGLFQGKLIFEVRQSATGLVLWLGDQFSIPLAHLLGEETAPSAPRARATLAPEVAAPTLGAPTAPMEVLQPVEVTRPAQPLPTIETVAPLGRTATSTSTRRPTATPTPLPPTLTPRATSTPLKSTHTPAVTRAPSATPAPVARALPPPLEPFVCAEPQVNDFSSGDAFGTGSADWARWGQASGEYYLAMKQSQSWVWRSDGFSARDLVLEVDVRAAAQGSGAYGLAFGADSLDNGQELYAFVISPDGYYALFRHTATEEWVELQPFTYSFLLYQGSQKNRLKVVRRGPLIALYANGLPLGSAHYDSTYQGARYAGLLAYSAETAGLEARFDSYTACPLTEPLLLPLFPQQDGQTLRWPADQPAVLHWAWFAATEALAQSFADLSEMWLTLDDQEFYGLREYWSTVSSYPSGYAVQWNLPLPPLERGRHRIEVGINVLESLTDGFDEDRDGRRDTYGPGEVFYGLVTIQVGD